MLRDKPRRLAANEGVSLNLLATLLRAEAVGRRAA